MKVQTTHTYTCEICGRSDERPTHIQACEAQGVKPKEFEVDAIVVLTDEGRAEFVRADWSLPKEPLYWTVSATSVEKDTHEWLYLIAPNDMKRWTWGHEVYARFIRSSTAEVAS